MQMCKWCKLDDMNFILPEKGWKGHTLYADLVTDCSAFYTIFTSLKADVYSLKQHKTGKAIGNDVN